MEYRGYIIVQDNTGYAPKHLQFGFYKECDELFTGHGECIEDCQNQIDEIIENED